VNRYEARSARSWEDYWEITRRRRWWLVLPLFFGWLLVVVAGHFIPPKYRSETVIIVEQQEVSQHYLLPNAAFDVQEWLQSMTQQILSRTRLEKIIDRFHLYEPGKGPRDSEALVEKMRQDIKIDLVQAPGRPGELSAFKISYSAANPALAQQVTNELTSLFIDENLHNQQRLSENTTEFLGGQLEQARNSLAQQEERLRDFKARNLGELPEQWQSNAQILSGLETRLQAAEESLDEAGQQQVYLESLPQYQNLSSQGDNAEGSVAATAGSVDEQLDRLNTKLAELSTRYTSNHPDVRHIKEQIAAAERLKQQLEALPGSQSTKTTMNSAAGLGAFAHTPMEGQIRANRLKIAHREQEVKRLEKQIELYQSHLNLTPLREQELAAITRDYNESRSTYESLLAKKTQSEMATNLQKSQQEELFSIIDPPNLPMKPYWPNRFKLSVLGMILGMVLGLGSTTLLEIYDPRIYRTEDLRSFLTAPVLAGIPLLQSANEQRKQTWHRRLELVTGTALMTAIPVITLFTYYRG
jgi:polysaccharide chain length determinant protein (PEP-CTERM system associated)